MCSFAEEKSFDKTQTLTPSFRSTLVSTFAKRRISELVPRNFLVPYFCIVIVTAAVVYYIKCIKLSTCLVFIQGKIFRDFLNTIRS